MGRKMEVRDNREEKKEMGEREGGWGMKESVEEREW